MQTIWVIEQLDPMGLLYACIVGDNAQQAQDCNASFLAKLAPSQLAAGWQVRMRTVTSWDDVPAGALKMD